jgi:hypothetical protein
MRAVWNKQEVDWQGWMKGKQRILAGRQVDEILGGRQKVTGLMIHCD